MSIYTLFAQVLTLSQQIVAQNESVLEALLDPETGFAPRMEKICRDAAQDLEDTISSTADSSTYEELELLKLEANTWSLLQALLPARILSSPIRGSPLKSGKKLVKDNPWTSPSNLVGAFLGASPMLGELVVVREWLHDTAPGPKATADIGNGYCRWTKLMLDQKKRTRGISTGGQSGLVDKLDPDAPFRSTLDIAPDVHGPTRTPGSGSKTLAPDDLASSRLLNLHLFSLLRAGKLEDACAVARRADSAWLSALMSGGKVWRGGWGSDSEEAQDLDEPAWKGNRNRKLWKELSSTSPLSAALLTSLVPTPSTLHILKPLLKTWEDGAWAWINVLCEERISSLFLQISATGPNSPGSISSSPFNQIAQGDEEDDDEEEWEEEARQTLDGLKSAIVEEGAPSSHPLHVTQLSLILNRTDSLLNSFADGLENQEWNMKQDLPPLLRFFAHLCMFLGFIDVSVPPNAVRVILEGYIRVLETLPSASDGSMNMDVGETGSMGHTKLLALYTAALGENAVERYAQFLVDLSFPVLELHPLDAAGETVRNGLSLEERREALMKAKENGFEMDRVAIAVAERSIQRSFDLLPSPLSLPLPAPSSLQLQAPPSPTEEFLLRSIEWTIFMETTYEEALEQVGVICRWFLGRPKPAQQLLASLPLDFGSMSSALQKSQGEQPYQATEYMHYRQFFAVWEILERCVEAGGVDSNMSRESRSAWTDDYRSLLDQARDMVIKLLVEEWLVVDLQMGMHGGEQRIRELKRIRQIYIPEVIIRLHMLLFTSRHRIPENLKHCLELVNIVADSRYRLYEDFLPDDTLPTVGSSQRMGDYLEAVRQAVIGGLDGGGADPWRVLTS